MKFIKNIVKFLFPPVQIAWKIRYTTGLKAHRIDYIVAPSDKKAIAKLQKRIKEEVKIISCEKV